MTTQEPGLPSGEKLTLAEQRIIEINALAERLGIELTPPPVVRDEATLPSGYEATAENEHAVRDYARTLRIGEVEDTTPDQRHMPSDATYLIEAGLFHKIVAETNVVINEGTGDICFAGCEARKVTDAEAKIAEEILQRRGFEGGFAATNEYQAALLAIISLEDFKPSTDMNAGVDGLSLVGTVNDRKIYLYNVPYTERNDGSGKYDIDLNTAEQLEVILEQTQKLQGGIVTSNSYLVSREGYVGARDIPVIGYGSATLDEVKTGTRPESPEQRSIAHILGELYRIREEYEKVLITQ